MNSVCSIDDQTLFAVGQNGTIIKTTDGGDNWSVLLSGMDEDLFSVDFEDAQNGWAVGYGGTILHTIDGGINWGKQPTGISEQLQSVHFVNAATGWAVGQNGSVLKTTDGGYVTLFPPKLISPANLSNDISTNPTLTWSTCSGATSYRLQVSTDRYFAGTILDQAGIVTTSTTVNGLSQNTVYYWRVNTQYGEGISNWSEIFGFTTAGVGWKPQISNVDGRLISVYFINPSIGWAVGEPGIILKTTDGGTNWLKKSINYSGTLQDIFFINESIGWTVGGWTTNIYKTTDGGDSWNEQPVGENTSFNSVYFIDELNGWAVTSNDIFKTTDGGANWLEHPSITSKIIEDAQFINATTGWIVGWSGMIFKSIDGGSTWIDKSSGLTSEELSHVFFINNSLGWVVGRKGTVLKTIDSGDSWISIDCGSFNYLSSILFVDEYIGWIVGEEGLLLKSSDGGINWAAQISGTENSLYSVYFLDALSGCVVGDIGTIMKTTDGGGVSLFPPIPESPENQMTGLSTDLLLTWGANDRAESYHVQVSNNPNFYNPLTEEQTNVQTTSLGLQDLKPNYTYHWRIATEYPEGYSCWSKIGIFVTGGTNWEAQFSGTNDGLNSVFFIDDSTGWVGGSFGIIKTYNGGDLWLPPSISDQGRIEYIYFMDKLNGLAFSSTYTLFITTDGGIQWSEKQISGLDFFPDAKASCFINTLTGWILGMDGKILKTTNGGDNWIEQNSGTSNGLMSSYFFNSSLGWIVGYSRTILHTSDGGTNWIKQESGVTYEYASFLSVFFVDAMTGWISGNGGRILHTTDGGNNWGEQVSNTFSSLVSAQFIDADTGWVVGRYGAILKTVDGGNIWEKQENETDKDLTAIHLVNSKNIWIVGGRGTILKIKPEQSVGVYPMDIKDVSLNSYKLLQNYPNPFNPDTYINYEIPKTSDVKLEIFNHLGQKVATLVDKKHSSGSYTVKWNGRDNMNREVASGVYLYRLQTKEFVYIRKLILIQ